nr:Abi family protein [Corynebacterium amycolatum]
MSHYRDEIKTGNAYSIEAYARMPIWVAVEAFSFGSLSRLIEASSKSGVLHDMAASKNVSPTTLPNQVRSFVCLRNRNAHYAKSCGTTLFSTVQDSFPTSPDEPNETTARSAITRFTRSS